MSRGFNQAIVMGNLTRDPEMRSTGTGQNVASFAIAVNRSWNDNNGVKQEAVDYFDIVAWGKLGELASSYLSKGRKVLVVGRLQNNNWEAQDGSKRTKTEIVASDLNFIGSREDNEGGSYQPSSNNSSTPQAEPKPSVDINNIDENTEINLDDIPF